MLSLRAPLVALVTAKIHHRLDVESWARKEKCYKFSPRAEAILNVAMIMQLTFCRQENGMKLNSITLLERLFEDTIKSSSSAKENSIFVKSNYVSIDSKEREMKNCISRRLRTQWK